MAIRWSGQGRPDAFAEPDATHRRNDAEPHAGLSRRSFLGALASLLTACGSRPRRNHFDAVVGPTSIGDAGHAMRYDSIAAALAAAPPGEQPYRIALAAGSWRERLRIDRPNVHLVGAGPARSRIVHATAAGDLRPDGQPWGTWGCATVIVRAPGFQAQALTIENDFDYLSHLRQPRLETIGANGAQAVALMLDAGADRCRFQDLHVTGHQDTLFADAGRAVFARCTISGSVDFVFGAGQALFEQCLLRSRFRPDKPRQGYVAAPSTAAGQAFGLVFRDCRLVAEPQVPAGSVALGRAWRPTRDFADGRYGDPQAVGAATYIDCWLDRHIAPEGWDAMAYTARDGSRVLLAPAQARLHEYRSRGPGANPARPQLSSAQARALQAQLAESG